MIEARGLVKTFGDFNAVDGLDLEVRRGECFGLLGPNGAGKSTVIGMLYGSVRRTAGELTVFGLDPSTQARDVKRRLGVVPQVDALDQGLTVRENLDLYARFVGVPAAEREGRVRELLSYMSLESKEGAPIRALSGGMQRRLVFVRALLGKPDLLILDEPTTGLDPAVRRTLWAKVRDLKSKGCTIVLTTHYMEEAQALCDRVAIVDRGRRLALASPRDLIAAHAPSGTLEDVFLTLTGRELDADD